MGITKDEPVENSRFIKREFVSHVGEVYATGTLAPSVLPMTVFSLDSMEQTVWLIAVKTMAKGTIRKGDIYRLKAIHQSGKIMVEAPKPGKILSSWMQKAVQDPERFAAQHPGWHINNDANRHSMALHGLWPMDAFAEYILTEVQFDEAAYAPATSASEPALPGVLGEGGGATDGHQPQDGGATPSRRPSKNKD